MSDAKEGGKSKPATRLFVQGRFVGYKRNKVKQNCNQHLLKLKGVESKKEVSWYLGKKVAFRYKAIREKNETRKRVIWGKITRHHGNSGMVRAAFKKNLPAQAMGKAVEVYLYPSKI
ncbi:hypothetical protein BSKO_04360 [Bryopsis sp. KO-2023]|nr:hypothetical protein BSKO_04360 [Bryopsis sp. KO-2023]